MAGETYSTNMNLPVPAVGVTSGPQYAQDINSSLTIIDAHNHTPGSGVAITPSGLNINSDLGFGSNNATLLRSVRFNSNAAVLSQSTDIGCLYETGVDLYYNDGQGNQVRLTQSGAVAGTPGSIANLASPASASYVSASSTFVFQSAASTPAYIDTASILLRNFAANSYALTLNPPSGMAANQTITLPSLPSVLNILTMDTSGNISAALNVDNSTLQITSNTVSVKPQGITASQIADGTITSSQIASATITGSNIAAATITGSNIAGATILTGNIGSATIVANNIAAQTLTGFGTGGYSNLDIGTVTGANIASATVTPQNRTTVNWNTSGLINATITATTYTAVTNSAVALVCSGNQGVMVGLQPYTSGSSTPAQFSAPLGNNMYLQLLRDGVPIATWLTSNFNASGENIFPPGNIVDIPTSGTHTYSLQAKVSNNAGVIAYFVLQATEL